MNGNRSAWGKFLLVAGGLSLVLAGCAFPAAFSGFEGFDDTGYMLVLIREFNAHGGLYTRVYSQYGPFFSEWHAGLSHLLGSPTQESVRWGVVAVWLGFAFAGGALAFRLAGSVFLAALAQGTCFLMLPLLTSSPGHPVGLSVLCVAALAGCAPLWRDGDGVPWRAVCAGLALGALGMIKVNVGVFALAAVGAAWAFGTPRDRAGLGLRWAAGALLCAMPLLLVRQGWTARERLGFTGLMVFSFLGVLLVAERDRTALTWRGASRLALGLLSGWVVITGVCLGGLVALGTRPADLLGGILLRPLRFAGVYGQGPGIPVLGAAVAAVSLAGALVWRFFVANPRRPGAGWGRLFDRICANGSNLVAPLYDVPGCGEEYVFAMQQKRLSRPVCPGRRSEELQVNRRGWRRARRRRIDRQHHADGPNRRNRLRNAGFDWDRTRGEDIPAQS